MATLRAAGRASQELIWAPSLTFWGWSWCGEQEAGDIGTWEPQARVFGNRGLRSSLPIWLDSDLVVQGEEHATHGLARWCQASTQGHGGSPRPHKTSRHLRKPCVPQLCKLLSVLNTHV